MPFGQLFFKLCRTGLGELIKLRFAAGFGGAPFCGNPALLLQPVERRIQRAVGDLQSIFADLLDAFSNRPAVLGLDRNRLQDEEIESALNEAGGAAHGQYLSYLYMKLGERSRSCLPAARFTLDAPNRFRADPVRAPTDAGLHRRSRR